jgi:hypothetical protein
MEISACGRTVRVGFGIDWDVSVEVGVIEDRKMGHCSIAFERVLRRTGRYVKRVY